MLTRQTEAAECGLACLAMVVNHHGYETDLASLRRRFARARFDADRHEFPAPAGGLNPITRRFPRRAVRGLIERREREATCKRNWP